MSTMNQLHVIFGTGPLGQSVMRALLKRGKQVRMINRSGKADVPSQVEVIASDAYDVRQVREVTQDAAVVYQCAQPAYHQWPQKFPALQNSILEGTAANDAILIVGDNLYMYGEVDGPMHENLPNNAHTRKGQVRAAMADAVLAAHRSGKLRAALVRGSDFYGPGVLASALGERIFYPMLAGKAAQAAGNIDVPHTYTFIDDFGQAMAMVGACDEALGQVWHAPNDRTLSTREVLQIGFDYLGIEPKINVMGKMMMRIGGLFIPEAREMVEMMYEFEKPFVVDNSKFAHMFGNHATPLENGIRQTIDWYRANPPS